MTAGELLRAWRSGKELSQASAAALFGLNQVRVFRLEAGSSLPLAHEAVRIAKVTGGAVPVDAWKPAANGTAGPEDKGPAKKTSTA